MLAFLLAITVSPVLGVVNVSDIGHTQRLLKDLFENYDPAVRPVSNHSNPSTIDMYLSLTKLVGVDDTKEMLTFITFTLLAYRNEFLSWAPADYGGVTHITVPSNKVWRPDIFSLEAANVVNIVPSEQNFVTVFHTGDTLIKSAQIVDFSCQLDVKEFPYDSQSCVFEYMSYAYMSNELLIQWWNRDAETIGPMGCRELDSPAWTIDKCDAKADIHNYGSDEHPLHYARIRFFFNMTRKSEPYFVTQLLPQILVTFLTIVGLFSPSSNTKERSEKITLGLTALLASSVMLSVVATTLPISAATPLITSFFRFQLYHTSACILIAVGIMYIHSVEWSCAHVPSWVTGFACMKPPPDQLAFNDDSATFRLIRQMQNESPALSHKLSTIEDRLRSAQSSAAEHNDINAQFRRDLCYRLDNISLVIGVGVDVAVTYVILVMKIII